MLIYVGKDNFNKDDDETVKNIIDKIFTKPLDKLKNICYNVIKVKRNLNSRQFALRIKILHFIIILSLANHLFNA